MANGYDFFGGQSGSGQGGSGQGGSGQGGVAAPVAGGQPTAPPAVDRWGMPLATTPASPQTPPAMPQTPYAPVPPGGYGQPTAYAQQPLYAPPAPAKSRHLQAAIGIVVVGALAASAYFFFIKPHPVSLPDTAGGLPAVTSLSSSQKDDIKDMNKQLGKDNVHDISTRVYGDGEGGPGLIVVAGHINKADANMQQVSSQVAAAAAGAGANLSSGPVSSGGTKFQCLWETVAGHTESVCFWWSNHAVLMGVGIEFDAQSTSDALAQVKAYSSLK
ncbi:MAG TPA: hypothetical protein VN738_12125 [Acidothermaceae bacterium]|nr:hypothetical protein [Acidothermaceae bacterium]